ncbi:MAG: helix-turn-helix transcriptional regulator [Muribaculum sp.]|nr:helix-turn-helix transcriptional regulator [Muribaculum sp.]
MIDIYASSDNRLIELIGAKVRTLRLNRNMTQVSVATDSGVTVSVVQRLENGAGCTLLNLIKILRGIDGLNLMNDFFKEEPVSPRMLAQLANTHKTRKRASKNNNKPYKDTPSW